MRAHGQKYLPFIHWPALQVGPVTPTDVEVASAARADAVHTFGFGVAAVDDAAQGASGSGRVIHKGVKSGSKSDRRSIGSGRCGLFTPTAAAVAAKHGVEVHGHETIQGLIDAILLAEPKDKIGLMK